jgi:predicted NBD/HSP70 family sugar kinase
MQQTSVGTRYRACRRRHASQGWPGLAEELGIALGSAVNGFDVELIVIGGGIAPGILARIACLRRAMAGALFARDEAAVRIVRPRPARSPCGRCSASRDDSSLTACGPP